jgi:hypothetical protein
LNKANQKDVAGTDVLLMTDAGNPSVPPSRRVPPTPIAEWLRHPLALLLVSSILIPSIVYFLQSRNASVAARQAKALSIINKNAEFDGQLYSIFTDLSFFNVHNESLLQKLKSTDDLAAIKKRNDELRDRRIEFDKEFAARYTEFSKSYSDQHLWVDDLVVEGVVLGLFSADDVRNGSSNPQLVKLKQDIEAYRKNVGNSRGVLGLFHDVLFRDNEYDPNKITGDWITGRYNRFHNERKLVVDELVRDFMP